MTWLSNEATNAASLLLAMLDVCLSLRLSPELRVALTRRSFRRSFRQDGDQTKGARERAASLAGTSTKIPYRATSYDPQYGIIKTIETLCPNL